MSTMCGSSTVSYIFTPHRSRFAGVSEGIAVIILAIISIGFPVIVSIIVISLLGIALLFSGISKVIRGINDKHDKNWRRIYYNSWSIFYNRSLA